MRIETRSFEFKLQDAESAKGIIRGYASTFGNIDQGMDIVEYGAFKKTLQENKGKVPILADHNPTTPIGWNLRAEEDKSGLFVEGQLNLTDPFAKGRYDFIKMALDNGAKMGLSIGYGVIKAMPDKERPSIRILKELKLYEYSVVTFPMNTEAMVTAAKFFKEGMERGDLLDAIASEILARNIQIKDLEQALLKRGAANLSDPADPAFCQLADTIMMNLTKQT